MLGDDKNKKHEEFSGNDGNNEHHKAQETMDTMIRMKFMLRMNMIINDDSDGCEAIYIYI